MTFNTGRFDSESGDYSKVRFPNPQTSHNESHLAGWA